MPNVSVDNKHIAKNTFLLYIRMFIVTIIDLYTVRVVLNVLGVENYGIYNVVAGVVSSLSFLTTVLSSATQRFYSFSIGKAQIEKLKNVFNVSLRCYLYLALIVIILGETVGLWFVNNKLSLPESRMTAALWAYHFSILSFVFTTLQIPFSALMIAKEDMKTWSFITIGSCLLKLLFALLIAYISYDILITYSASLSFIWLLILILYIVISRMRYQNICKFNIKFNDKNLFKEMVSYSGWSLYGAIAGVGINQGITIIINLFFNPTICAARAISLQINSAISAFCNSFITAVRPPIVKSYASGDISRTIKLFYFSNKFIYYCTLMICIPLILEMNLILKIWLKEVSEYMVVFSQYGVVCAFILVLAIPVTIIIQASGDIKRYHAIVETFTLLIMPIAYFVYKMGGTPQTSYIVMAILFLMAQIFRIKVLARKIKELSLKNYCANFLYPAILVTVLSLLIICSVQYIMGESVFRIIIIVITSILTISVFSYFFGMTESERHFLKKMLNRRNELTE